MREDEPPASDKTSPWRYLNGHPVRPAFEWVVDLPVVEAGRPVSLLWRMHV
jgi:hypothetical protein